MRISTKGRYALRLMTDLCANDQGGYVSLKDAAERQGISLKYLEQIAGMLSKAGLLQSGPLTVIVCPSVERMQAMAAV